MIFYTSLNGGMVLQDERRLMDRDDMNWFGWLGFLALLAWPIYFIYKKFVSRD